ncbi:hypothetical protein [Desulfovibrio ferrophilus]|uniref:Capsule polysaccharide biosynthesis protein n=1 Tax=Desulfovibrio ferrophilus TaxID=241368 RepID=A0A2Z6B1I0_9BACT|nr:hypothetical protein [Desulfovibrio ferrophilus]BBD09323.1 capsule polysaccharide biosynthesis protein [Desulfovibrio ferrophilus]
MIPFHRQAELFASFVNRSLPSILAQHPQGEKIGVVITRWSCNTVPWFNLALALMLRAAGTDVVLIYDDMTENIIPGDHHHESALLNAILTQLSFMPLVHLSEMSNVEASQSDLDFLQDNAKLNAFYINRTTVPTAKVLETQARIFQDFLEVMPKIKGVFNTVPMQAVVIPGGLAGHSGLFIRAGKSCGVRTSTYDSGPNEFLMGANDVAGYLRDIPSLVKAVDDFPRFEKALKLSEQEFSNRLARKDDRQFQPVTFDEDSTDRQFDALIPLNVECDTASLLPRSDFSGLWDWLNNTIEFILKEGGKVAVREHPSIYNHSGLLSEKLVEQFSGNPRFHFFRRTDPVNTYRLVADSKFVLPYASTVGVETAMMGKTTLVESPVYYSELAFVTKARSADDYFRLIREFRQSAPPTNADQQREAKICFYYLYYCNYLRTKFTPIPENFEEWINSSIDALASQDELQMIIKAYREGIPLAKLNSKRQFNLD